MITKLPDEFDNSIYIKNIIDKKCGASCPFCGEKRSLIECIAKNENKGFDSFGVSTWYGQRWECGGVKFKTLFHNPFKKSHHWRKDSYKCWTCGAKWDTPAYPNEQLSSKEFARIVEEIEKELYEYEM